jgi:hypothetical protein
MGNEISIEHGELKILNQDLQELRIPRSVTSIPNYCFCRCSKLQKITRHSSLTSMEEKLFIVANALKQLKCLFLSHQLHTFAFSQCGNLKKVYLPSSISFQNDTFANSPCTLIKYDGSSSIQFNSSGQSSSPEKSIFQNNPLLQKNQFSITILFYRKKQFFRTILFSRKKSILQNNHLLQKKSILQNNHLLQNNSLIQFSNSKSKILLLARNKVMEVLDKFFAASHSIQNTQISIQIIDLAKAQMSMQDAKKEVFA